MLDALTKYADLTDLAALQKFSAKPLRKSIRVNTIKSSVDCMKSWGVDKGWKLEPVPWCNEGFFIDREDRSQALGKDLFHLLGHIYMQEAASMLPVSLLDPQPGEVILDMSAAPGSKTTQIAARMEGRGVVIANDVQEKRLWTLKSAIYRSGCTNVIVTKKKGQWFGRRMAERFDRVLCDAPCTAEGTVRKDSEALKYTSEENIAVMSGIQIELLEAAVHACKPGGRIVYSTCTLTPQENEEVIEYILNKFSDQLIIERPNIELKDAIKDSKKVSGKDHSLIRLWPQTYDTEGFFCAVLKKKSKTCDPEIFATVPFQERGPAKSKLKSITKYIEDRYGTTFLEEGDRLFERENQLVVATEDVRTFELPVINFALGIPYGKAIKDRTVRLDHDLVTLRGHMATQNVIDITEEHVITLLDGKDIECDESLKGDIILRWNNLSIGIGLAQKGTLKNRLPRWIVQKS